MNKIGYILLGTQILAITGLVITYLYLWRRDEATIIDAATIPIPILLWFGLLNSGILPKSLSNLVIEPLLLFPIIVFCLVARTFLFSKSKNINRSRAAFYLAVIAAISVYAFVPVLPE